ncbi:MAG: hypothetical protein HC845_10915 [Akkermansiaceae bacterium]|nr:hypothetical protein [Akkermansiaceae bacterium]
MRAHPSVNVARLTYLLVCEAAGVAIALSTNLSIGVGLLGGLGVAALFIWMETLMKGFTLRGFSTASFGLGVGLFCAWLLTRVDVSNLINLAFRDKLITENGELDVQVDLWVNALKLSIDVALYASLGFLGTVLALRSNRDDFAFIIPYVRFRQDSLGGQPVVLDSEAVMDGRVLGIFRSGFLHGRLIVPRFILDELQTKAANASGPDRHRAQRGLDSLEQMQNPPTSRFPFTIILSPALLKRSTPACSKRRAYWVHG